MIHIVYWHI